MEGPDRSAPGDAPLPGEMRIEPSQASVYAGRYAVDSEIGRGAMGRVLRARDAKIGREVALKILDFGIAKQCAATLPSGPRETLLGFGACGAGSERTERHLSDLSPFWRFVINFVQILSKKLST